MQVLILAGGIGRRFWPLEKSKYLFSFLGKTLIEHNLDKLKAAGFNRVVIAASPDAAGALNKLNYPDLDLKIIVQKEADGMSGALLAAENSITEDPLLIINATDIVNSSLFKEIMTAAREGKNALVGKKQSSYFSGGYYTLEGNRVVAVVEKPKPGTQPSDIVKLVFDLFQNPRAFIEAVRTKGGDTNTSYERTLDDKLKEDNFTLIPYDDYWQATKYPWHLLDVMELLFKDLKEQRGDNVEISDRATVKGPVVFESNVRVLENAVISGPAYIGEGTVIGNGALVRQSHLGKNCVVGFATEVARSYVGAGCWFHSNYIGDSVLEANINPSAGTVLANSRIDEGEIGSYVDGIKIMTGRNRLGAILGKNVRVGVNTSFMPGVKVGSGSFIGPGLTVYQDIKENSFVRAKPTLTVTNNRANIQKGLRDALKKNL